MLAKAPHLTRDEVAAAFSAQLDAKPVTFGVRVTVFWLRHVLAERLVA